MSLERCYIREEKIIWLKREKTKIVRKVTKMLQMLLVSIYNIILLRTLLLKKNCMFMLFIWVEERKVGIFIRNEGTSK